MRIFLVGPRGSGKSTVGKALAKYLSWKFVDTDLYLQEHLSDTIKNIVSSKGWNYFREQETLVLKEIIKNFSSSVVIATGGGIILSETNRKIMNQNGKVAYLSVNANILAKRLQINPEEEMRPALTDLALQEEIEQILQERIPLYEQCSDIIIDASETIDENVRSITTFLVGKIL